MVQLVVANRRTFCWGAWLCLVVACADASCPSGTTEMNGRCIPVAEIASGTGGDNAVGGSGGNFASGQAGVERGASGGGAGSNSFGTAGASSQSSSSDAGGSAGGSPGSSGTGGANGAAGSEVDPSGVAGSDAEPSDVAGNGGAGAASPEPDDKTACVAEEEVCDAMDNDCDGATDETLTRPCGPEMPRGECKAGIDTCVAGMWMGCMGAVEARMETCDVDRLDENCDGMRNEGCDCVPGETQECGNNQGVCRPGVETCMNGRWGGACEGAQDPMQREVCDQAEEDEDCDGEANPNCECYVGQAPRPCPGGIDTGECSAGTQMCNAGKWSACSGQRGKQVEMCDGDDDDCDGVEDNAPSDCRSPMMCRDGKCEECTNGRSEDCEDANACQPPRRTCSNGQWGECTGGLRCESDETCTDGRCISNCNNGNLDPGEQCDPGMTGWSATCNSSDCTRRIYQACSAPGGPCGEGGVCGQYNQYQSGGGSVQLAPICTKMCGTESDCPRVGDYENRCTFEACAILCDNGRCPPGMRCDSIELFDFNGAWTGTAEACVL